MEAGSMKLGMEVEGVWCDPGDGAERVAKELFAAFPREWLTDASFQRALWLAYVRGRADQYATDGRRRPDASR